MKGIPRLARMGALALLGLALGVSVACGRYGPPRRIEVASPPPVGAQPTSDVDLYDHEDEEVWHDDAGEGEIDAFDGETEEAGW